MHNFIKLIFLPLLVSVLVGIGSAAVTVAVVTVRLEERMNALERNVVKHEAETSKAVERHEKQLQDITKRDNEQEQRLTRGESMIESISSGVSEIRADVKTLIRERK